VDASDDENPLSDSERRERFRKALEDSLTPESREAINRVGTRLSDRLSEVMKPMIESFSRSAADSVRPMTQNIDRAVAEALQPMLDLHDARLSEQITQNLLPALTPLMTALQAIHDERPSPISSITDNSIDAVSRPSTPEWSELVRPSDAIVLASVWTVLLEAFRDLVPGDQPGAEWTDATLTTLALYFAWILVMSKRGKD
jgi:translation elongation factor EF-G